MEKRLSKSAFASPPAESIHASRRGTEPEFESVYFGTRCGSRFNVEKIETIIEEWRRTYHDAPAPTKEDGLEVYLQPGDPTSKVPWKRESIITPFQPKKPILRFLDKCTVFMSKQVPLLLVAQVRQPGDDDDTFTGEPPSKDNAEIIKIMYKCGDDLRQDNLVLQFFRIMDEMWMD